MFSDLYGDQYRDRNIRVYGNKSTHILWEQMDNFVYLHEWRNIKRGLDGFKLGLKFIKEHNNIVCSTLKDKVVSVAKRYGFEPYKKTEDRTYLIRREK